MTAALWNFCLDQEEPDDEDQEAPLLGEDMDDPPPDDDPPMLNGARPTPTNQKIMALYMPV